MQAFLVDSSIYIFRSYFTLPDNWHSADLNMSTNAVYGFTNFMLDILRQKNPTHILCAFDESLETGFRHQLAPDYKANRELPDEALAFQLNACRQVCRVLGVNEIASKIYEADDLIGSMAKTAGNADIQPIIVSKDKDLMQLIGNNELYWDFGRSQPQAQKELERTLELGCHQMADYLALVGDASDNIAGIAGIGKKTALKLIVELQDRLVKLELVGSPEATNQMDQRNNPNSKQAIEALQSLGFKTKEANRMVSKIDDQDLSTEQLIRLALQNK